MFHPKPRKYKNPLFPYWYFLWELKLRQPPHRRRLSGLSLSHFATASTRSLPQNFDLGSFWICLCGSARHPFDSMPHWYLTYRNFHYFWLHPIRSVTPICISWNTHLYVCVGWASRTELLVEAIKSFWVLYIWLDYINA